MGQAAKKAAEGERKRNGEAGVGVDGEGEDHRRGSRGRVPSPDGGRGEEEGGEGEEARLPGRDEAGAQEPPPPRPREVRQLPSELQEASRLAKGGTRTI